MLIVVYDTDGGNTAPRCTPKADSKRCLILHVATALPSSNIQEKMTTTLGGKEQNLEKLSNFLKKNTLV